MKPSKILLLLLAAIGMMACNQPVVYSEYKNVPLSGWNKDSVLSYTIDVTDTAMSYDLVLSLRHGQNYPFQNIWFFVGGLTPDGALTPDTLEFFLADDRGSWLGNGVGDNHEMPCLIGQDIRFPKKGEYTYYIQHGMRSDVLEGVNEVGLILEEHGKE